MSTEYRVVIFARPDDPHLLRDVLSEQLKLHRTDAMIHAHAAPGILPDRLSGEKAAALVAEIEKLGLHAESIPEAEVPDLENADSVHHARCEIDGLAVIGLHGRGERIVSWNDLQLISVGSVPDNQTHHWVAESTSFAGPHHSPEEVEPQVEFGPELWIVGNDGDRGIRIDHAQMNYEYLGPRMTLSATKNFHLFIEDLAARSGPLCLTPATRHYLNHAPAEKYRFSSSDALRDYTVFQLLVHERIRKQTEGQDAEEQA